MLEKKFLRTATAFFGCDDSIGSSLGLIETVTTFHHCEPRRDFLPGPFGGRILGATPGRNKSGNKDWMCCVGLFLPLSRLLPPPGGAM